MSAPTGTTAAPDVAVDLDERTKTELQPPCEVATIRQVGTVVYSLSRCEHPAEWVICSRCDRCQRDDHTLMCTTHFEELRDHPRGVWLCQLCRHRSTRLIVSRDRLR